MTSRRDRAEELAQEIFIRCYRAAPSYQASAKFSTWIFHIAPNTCLNELRRPEYRHPSEVIGDHPRPSPGANPESHAVSSKLQKDRKSNRMCVSIPPF
jgi:RNA polymerase sigma factor (sigma-70 family)